MRCDATRSRSSAVNVRHRVLAYGYVLVEDARPGRFDAALAEQLGVTPGPDFGRLQRGETVSGRAPEQVDRARARGAQGRRLRRHRAVRDAWRSPPTRADLLIHEATFGEDERERAR